MNSVQSSLVIYIRFMPAAMRASAKCLPNARGTNERGRIDDDPPDTSLTRRTPRHRRTFLHEPFRPGCGHGGSGFHRLAPDRGTHRPEGFELRVIPTISRPGSGAIWPTSKTATSGSRATSLDSAVCRQAVAGAEYVFHEAAIPSVPRSGPRAGVSRTRVGRPPR